MKKHQMKEKAQKHTEDMVRLYSGAIDRSIKDTRIYGNGFSRSEKAGRGAQFILEKSYTQDSVIRHAGKGRLAVLVFASYRHPGGGFINGAVAQEETLCHYSFLYNVLQSFTGFYEWNEAHYNMGLYTNRALYSPDVYFFGEDEKCYVSADTITCAAPNRSVMLRTGRFTEQQNEDAIRDRIRFIRDICDTENVDTLIAGAFGCGVFAQKPEIVAHCFREAFSDTKVSRVIFAVPPDRNYGAFEKEFIG